MPFKWSSVLETIKHLLCGGSCCWATNSCFLSHIIGMFVLFSKRPCRRIPAGRSDVTSSLLPICFSAGTYSPGSRLNPGAGCASRCWCPAVAPKGHQTSLPHQLWPGEAALCPSLLCACAAWSRGDLNKVHISGITDFISKMLWVWDFFRVMGSGVPCGMEKLRYVSSGLVYVTQLLNSPWFQHADLMIGLYSLAFLLLIDIFGVQVEQLWNLEVQNPKSLQWKDIQLSHRSLGRYFST